VPQSFSVGAHVYSRWTAALGQPTSPEIAVTASGKTGYYQNFSGGQGLIASPGGSVYTASGAIYESWTPLSWGWPTGDPTPLAARGINGYTQTFSEGTAGNSQAFWTPNYGTAWVDGTILAEYNKQGGPAGSWGWPTASIQKQSGFGVAGTSLALQGSRSVISSKYGLFVSDGGDGGAIAAAWSPARWGWPTAAPARTVARGITGYRQTFAEGATGVAEAFWTPNYRTTWLDGAVLNTYRAVGGPAWGWPTSSIKKQMAFGAPGSFVALQNGRSIISSKYGTFSGNGVDKGAVFASWSPARYGWPTTRLTAINAHGIAGYQQKFAQSSTAQTRAFWSAQVPTPIWLGGTVLSRYDVLGGTPVVGWPTAVATTQAAFGVQGSIQRFQSRALITSSYGTYSSNGLMLASWKPALRGWPTADLRSTMLKGKAGWLQTFRRGAKGLDYGFLAKGTRTVVWVSGTPPK
ncbi:MAG TPA: hypothetical protein VN108_06485, partial [Marmoricola sp.]|nr:hypothetical protein [Marmoricola sp.]